MLFDRVKKLSEDRGENLKIVAHKLGFSENAFYKWKTQSPKSETLGKVADYFGVSTDYLLCRTDDPAISNDIESEFDEEVRVLAREMQHLDQVDKDVLFQLVQTMRKRGKEALDE